MIKLYDVYSLFDVTPLKGEGAYVFDDQGQKYLDLYGGHAVISIGHSHPHYVKRIKAQLDEMVFYSNSVQNPMQQELCETLSRVSGIQNYDLFLCNSGAEANENALKLASFHNGRTKILSLKKGFHGRTSAAVNTTDSQKIIAPINKGFEVEYFDLDHMGAMYQAVEKGDACAVIIESIQGIGGIIEVPDKCLQKISSICAKTDTVFIADEVQCGFARSGDFFAFEKSGIRPDVISMAKGMGNGFPIGGVLINSEKIPAWKGMLGSTFGGNHLACAACLGVLEVIEKENLKAQVEQQGTYILNALKGMDQIKEIRGRGLMIGLEFDFPIKSLRKDLLFKEHIFTGSSSNPNVMRLLPPLNITKEQLDIFVTALKNSLEKITA